jgi:hypothetical protein
MSVCKNNKLTGSSQFASSDISWPQCNAHRIIGDTCVAMTEWVANPRSGTSFDMIMQCKANSYNSSSSSSFSHVGLHLIEDVDQIQSASEYKLFTNINQQSHDDFYLSDSPNPDNQWGHSLSWVENSMQKKKSMQIKTSTPPTSANDSCAQLRNSFVPIFNTIATNNCPSMRRNAKWVRVAIASLSWGSMTSICLWIIYTQKSTMKLAKAKASGTPLPTFQFQESNIQKTEPGPSTSPYSTGPSTPSHEISLDMNGKSRRRPSTSTKN